MEQKVWLVTGASKGIGLQIVLEALKAGISSLGLHVIPKNYLKP